MKKLFFLIASLAVIGFGGCDTGGTPDNGNPPITNPDDEKPIEVVNVLLPTNAHTYTTKDYVADTSGAILVISPVNHYPGNYLVSIYDNTFYPTTAGRKYHASVATLDTVGKIVGVGANPSVDYEFTGEYPIKILGYEFYY